MNPTALSHDGVKIFDYGVLGADDLNEKVCRNDAFDPVIDCRQYLKTDVINDFFMQNAPGKTELKVEGINAEAFNYHIEDPELREKCQGHGSLLFIQMACTYDQEQLNYRRLTALYIGCIIVASSLFIILYTDYLYKTFEIMKKVHDVNTVSAADYTVVMDFGWEVF